MARRGANGSKTRITQEELSAILGVDLATPAVADADRESAMPYEGWPCAVDTPVCQLLRRMFPIEGDGTASMKWIGDKVFCLAPNELRAVYYLTFEIQLIVRGWASPVQHVYAPPIPLLVDGSVVVGKRKLASSEALLRWYERELDKHRAGVVRRLKQCERSKDEHVQSLMAHDVWS